MDDSPSFLSDLTASSTGSSVLESFVSFEGIVEAVIYHDPGTGFTVVSVRRRAVDSDKPTVVSVRGRMAETPSVGHCFSFSGSWIHDPKRGLQFEVSDMSEPLPSTAEGIEAWLASGVIPGVGAKMAHRIVSVFGVNTFAVIRDDPTQLLSVSGVGEKVLSAIIERVGGQVSHIGNVFDLCRLGCTRLQAKRIIRERGVDGYGEIRRNPYVLVDVWGLGFRLADQIAVLLDIARFDDRRVHGGMRAVLIQAGRFGHMAMSRSGFLSELHTLLQVPIYDLELRWNVWIESGWILEFGGLVYLPEHFEAERALSSIFGQLARRRIDHGSLRAKESRELTKPQSQAVWGGLHAALSVVHVGPGSGASRILKALSAEVVLRGWSLMLVAPTESAANYMRRMSNQPAFSFDAVKEQLNLLKHARVVVLWDAQCLDVLRYIELLHGVNLDEVRVVLMGDRDELAPLGLGNVFRDCWDVGIFPTTIVEARADGGFRSGIIQVAQQVSVGTIPKISTSTVGKNFSLRLVPDTKDVLPVVGEVLRQTGFSSDDVQVLSPIHRTPLGTEKLNEWLQRMWNSGPKPVVKGFREGDRVISLCAHRRTKNVGRGQVGFVTKVESRTSEVWVSFGQVEVVYVEEDLCELDLGYALTIHGARGLQFACTVLILGSSLGNFLTREMLYTVLKQTRQYLVIVGTTTAVAHGFRNISREERLSGLFFQ